MTVFEKEDKLGGMLTLGIPSFRLDKDIVNAEIEILRELGVKFRTGVEVGKDVTLDALRADGYKAFYLGIGASRGTSVGCKGDDLAGVFTGIDFLREVNLGKNAGDRQKGRRYRRRQCRHRRGAHRCAPRRGRGNGRLPPPQR